MNDWELIQDWASRRSESAFAELVRRHLDFVYASALRQVCEPELARDITQAVFLALARKAGSLGRGVILSGWLFRTTRFMAIRALRAEQRRQRREQAAVTMNPHPAETPSVPEHWAEVEPHLDAALAGLSASDRDALLLRFFGQKSLREVGGQLGIGEDAAKKRVSRAVERLRTLLVKRGVGLTLAGLTTLLTQLPAPAAPAGMTGAITAAAASGTVATSVAALLESGLNAWLLVRLRWLAPLAAGVVLLLVPFLRLNDDASDPSRAAAGGAEQVAAVGPTVENPEQTTDLNRTRGGFTIHLQVRDAQDNRPLAAQVRQVVPQLDNEFVTGADGSLEIPVLQRPAHQLSLAVSAPGYVPVMVTWLPHEFSEPVLFHTCRLQPGKLLRGVVINESGSPVSGAEVRFSYSSQEISRGREAVNFRLPEPPVVTGPDGCFVTDQVPALIGYVGGMQIQVRHPDFALEEHDIQGPWELQRDVIITLRSGIAINGQVLGPFGEPVSQARVYVETLNIGTHSFAHSDLNGNFRLPPVTRSLNRAIIWVAATADGYERESVKVTLTNDPTTVSFHMKPAAPQPNDRIPRRPPPQTSTRFFGTAVDMDSGELLPSFQVQLFSEPPGMHEFLGEGRTGWFDWEVSTWEPEAYVLEATAEGYQGERLTIRTQDRTDAPLAFRLRRQESIVGRVVFPDGQPAAGVYVGLDEADRDYLGSSVVELRPSGGAPHTITDHTGAFRLPAHPAITRVLALDAFHSAVAPIDSLGTRPVVLKPWGKVSGTVTQNGRPLIGVSVRLVQKPVSPLGNVDIPPGFGTGSPVTTTDLAGQYHFDRVFPGPAVVQTETRLSLGPMRGITRSVDARQIEVVPGAVTEADFELSGRLVTGRLKLSRPVAGHDWRDELEELVPWGGEPLVLDDPVRRLQDAAPVRRFLLRLERDGNFRAVVPAGSYVLRLVVQTPYDDLDETGELKMWPRPILGRLDQLVVIPEARSDPSVPFDLGEFVVPVSSQPGTQ